MREANGRTRPSPGRSTGVTLYLTNVAEDERVTGPAYDRYFWLNKLCLFARGKHEDQ